MRMLKRSWRQAGAWFLLSAAVLILDGGCSVRQGQGTADKGSGSRSGYTASDAVVMQENAVFDVQSPQIGLSVDSFIIERWLRDRDVFVATAKELGVEVNVQDAGGDAEEQISQIRYLIDKGMDALVIVARDCDALSDVVFEAEQEGISVIAYDRMIYNADVDLYISFDNYAVGELMAQSLVDALPEGGEIFMIQGSPDDNNVYQVQEGFNAVISDSALDVVYTAYCDGWLAEQAVEYVGEALEQYPQVRGIMCGNDDIASQVVQVLAEHQLAGKVLVTGQDGDIAACQRIVEGTQYMTVFKAVEDEAKCAAEYALRLAGGENLRDMTETENDGTYDVPALVLSPAAVTAANMDEIIIEGGYHSQEDVYLNVKK